jgi:hypothetical protein
VSEGLVEQSPCRPGIVVEAHVGQLQRDEGCDEPLLGALVQISGQPPARLLSGGDDAGTARQQFLVGGGVGDGYPDELGEARDPSLGARWQRRRRRR